MQKIRILILLIVITPFSSCQFNQSVNTDLVTGAYSRGNGIGCDEVIIKVNGKTVRNNEFVFGEKVNLNFNYVNGLTKVDNKTYPGISLHILKNEKDTMLSQPNLLKSSDDGIDISPLQLNTNFVAALPFQHNEKYKAYVDIWDKKGDGTYSYELPFTIKENDLINIENNGIEYSKIYLWNETTKRPVFDKNVNSEHILILLLDGLKGLEINNNEVFPVFSFDIFDNNGKSVLSNESRLSDYEMGGINPEQLKTQLTAKMNFLKGEINNPCKLIAKLKDKNSSKEISIMSELEIN